MMAPLTVQLESQYSMPKGTHSCAGWFHRSRQGYRLSSEADETVCPTNRLLLRRRQSQTRLGQGPLHHAERMNLGRVARDRDFRNQHVPGTVQHLFLTERERLVEVQLQKRFADLGGLEQISALHLLGIFLKTHFPIRVVQTETVGQERKNARNLPVLRDSPQSNIGRVGKRNQHSHTVAPEPQKIEFLEG